MSSIESLTDVAYVEMLLFLHVNFDSIQSLHIPAFQRDVIRELLPKRFTGRDAELEAAETLLLRDVAYTHVPNEEA